MTTTLWNEFLQLPRAVRSRRISFSTAIEPGAHREAGYAGAGCIRHWWCTFLCRTPEGDLARAAHDVRLQIWFDGSPVPAVDQPLDTFFGTFLDQEPLMVNSAPITVLRRNAFNAWFPMPYTNGFRYRFTNRNPHPITLWFMADVHCYDSAAALTPLRFSARYNLFDPAPGYSFVELADIAGRGFVAGLVHGTDARDPTDSWYHTGGDTWLLDGEGDPMIIRGNGGEDVVGYSFGVHRSDHLWQGTLYTADPEGRGAGGTPCIFYRFFGPDAILFNESALCKFGSREARIETNLYYYSQEVPHFEPDTIHQWYLCGPFDGRTFEAFDRQEFPETEAPSDRTFATELPAWQPDQCRPPEQRPPAYRGRWVAVASRHGWVDFLDAYRGIGFGNHAAGGEGGAAYALGWLESAFDAEATLRLSFDDWMRVWVNDEHVATRRHEGGFATAEIPVRLHPGRNKLLLKLSNAVNLEFLAWAFNLQVLR